MFELLLGPSYNSSKKYQQWCPIHYKDQCDAFWKDVKECEVVKAAPFSSKRGCTWDYKRVPCGDFSPEWLAKLTTLHQQALIHLGNEKQDRAWERHKAANAAKAEEKLSPEEREAVNRRNERASAAEGRAKTTGETMPSELVDVLDFILDITELDVEMTGPAPDNSSHDTASNSDSKPAGRVSSKQYSMREMFEDGKDNLRKQNATRQGYDRWFRIWRNRQGQA
jgi:hypothetical protein